MRVAHHAEGSLPRIARLVRRHRRSLAAAAAAGSIATLGLALQPPEAPTRAVVVAAADLPSGRSLTAEDLVVADVPAGVLPTGTHGVAGDLVGRVLAAPLATGEPVGDHRLTAPPTWSLPTGMMPLPVRFSDARAVGLLSPGQRIDVLAWGDHGLDAGSGAAADVVVEGVLVLAVVADSADGLRSTTGSDEPALVLLAVDSPTARAIAGAQSGRQLGFLMRPRL